MNNHREKERWILGSLLLNLFLSLLKLIFAVITGSLALIAEVIHSFSDLAASVISLIGVKLSEKRLKSFPYGLYKLENMVAIIIAFFLFFASYEIIKEVIFNNEKREIKNPEFAVVVILIAMVLTFTYSYLEKRAGDRLNSPALVADAKHIWADFLSSTIVLIGLVGVMLGFHNVDKYAAGIVSLFILHSGYEIFKEGIKVLLDVSLSQEDIEKIKVILSKNPYVEKVKIIRGRVAGSYKFIEIEILLKNLGLREAHSIVDSLAESIKEEVQNVDSVFIHYEPVRQQGLRIAVLTDGNDSIKDFSSATEVIIIDIKDSNKMNVITKIDVKSDEREIGKVLSDKSVDIVVTKNHPEDFQVRFLISKAGILVWETKEDKFEKAVDEVVKSWSKFIKSEGEI
ncbi:MAG: cation diffusion facilitator family transporter [Hydrogenothermaceae bacterium]